MGSSGRLVVLIIIFALVLLWNVPSQKSTRHSTPLTPSITATHVEDELFDSKRYISKDEYSKFFAPPLVNQFTSIEINDVNHPKPHDNGDSYRPFFQIDNFEQEQDTEQDETQEDTTQEDISQEDTSPQETSPQETSPQNTNPQDATEVQKKTKTKPFIPQLWSQDIFNRRYTPPTYDQLIVDVSEQDNPTYKDDKYFKTNPFHQPQYAKMKESKKNISIQQFQNSDDMWIHNK